MSDNKKKSITTIKPKTLSLEHLFSQLYKASYMFQISICIIRLCINKQIFTGAISSYSRLKSTTFLIELMTLVWPANIIGPDRLCIQGHLCTRWKIQVL